MSDENLHKYFTAGEVATLVLAAGIKGFPTTESGMIRWIKGNLGDESLEYGSRKRKGQKGGGGTEYHWAWFPTMLMPVLDAEVERRNALAPYEPPASLKARRARAKLERIRSTDMTGPTGAWVEALAAAAGLDGEAMMFQSFITRKVSRCFVHFDNRKFFNRDLNGYHGKMVCATMADAAPHLLWVLEYENPRYSCSTPGRLICVADDRLGKAPYVSVEFQHAAEAKRAEGRVRRALLR